MKKSHVSAIIAALVLDAPYVPLTYAAAEDHSAHHAQAAPAAKAQSGKASGVVQKVDPKKGTVTIEHGPISGLDRPGMTMSFPVRDKASLTKLKPQQKVDFTVQYDGKSLLITRIH